MEAPSVDTFVWLESEGIRRWTVPEYHRMAETGVLDPDERTELIAGQILLMAAKGTPHVVALGLLAERLRNCSGDRALVRTQDPIQLDDYSEPEPDLAMVRGQVLDYLEHHPQPPDVFLVVEVADTTLRRDCEVKDKVYARAGIADYWVLAVSDRQLHVFREPTATGYASHQILTEPATITPLAFPDMTLHLSEILLPEI
jgi:Uma2 family endonuclease